MIVSEGQQRDSAICTHVSILSHPDMCACQVAPVVSDSAMPRTVACQAPLSMEFRYPLSKAGFSVQMLAGNCAKHGMTSATWSISLLPGKLGLWAPSCAPGTRAGRRRALRMQPGQALASRGRWRLPAQEPQPMSSRTSLYPPLFFPSVSFLSSKLLPSHQKPTSNIHSFPQFSLRAAKIHYSMMCVPTYILSLKAIFLHNRHF